MTQMMDAVSGAPSVPELSPALIRDWGLLAGPNERSVRRRLGWVWGLLFFNILTYTSVSTNLIPLPHQVGKALPELALAVALVLALTVNKRLVMRPNVLLLLFTAMCLCAAIMSFRGYSGLGSAIRWGRFAVFVWVLWLTTPWWGRRDFMVLHFQRRALMVVIGTVLLGLAISPGKAFANAGGGRLAGIVWPIPPNAVVHYAAVLVGMTVVLWLAGALTSRGTAVVVVAGSIVLLLTHSRVGLIAMLAGILVGGLSLFLSRRRVRRAFLIAIVVLGLGALSFAPVVTGWFERGESAQALSGLSGRTSAWSTLLAQPRTEANTLFGYGMSNNGINGVPIDSSWLATFQDQGLVGDVLEGLVLLSLLLAALISPRGPGRAVALFLVVYCAIASVTETGLGQPSSYILDLAVAMSVLMQPLTSDQRRAPVVVPRVSG
jgi:O-Antigen ligase